jgi:hypothetical protein
MAEKSTPAGPYYYAGGEKIKLTPADDLLAVEAHDMRSLAGASSSVGRALRDGLRLVTKDELGDAAEGLGGPKPKYPVFRSHGGIVVALPEVRVEESRKAYQAKLDKWLAEHGDNVMVVSRSDDRMVLEPVSGSGEDALAIANDLAEEVDPEIAQARFIRVTPRPSRAGQDLS